MNWCCFSSFLKKENDPSYAQDTSGLSISDNVKSFTYSELTYATENFHPSNKIGRGGFGTVFKGVLKNGTRIAVKKLSAWSKQGDIEFTNEMKTIANVRHPNLVNLIGFCVQNNNRLLVYELMDKGNLAQALLGEDTKTLDWKIRSGICTGIAEGLKYLHEEVEPHIIHRDIKATNILLDANCIPRIGDFGLAKLFPDNATHLSTRVAGTTGYLAPEYVMSGKLTKKADVYSFGVLVLEVVSGKSSSKLSSTGINGFLLEQTWKLYQEGRLIELVDPNLEEYPLGEVLKFMKVALFCTQGAANRRPNMTQVVEMLSNKIRLDEKNLMRPGLIDDMLKLNVPNKQTSSSSQKNLPTVVTSGHETGAFLSCSDVNPR